MENNMFDADQYETISDNGMILFNATGDVAITWKDDQDVEVLSMIEDKMKEGYTFFILEEKFFKTMKRKKIIRDANEIGKDRTVYLDDSRAEDLVKTGKVQVVKLDKPNETLGGRRAKTKEEVAGNKTAAFRPVAGG
jgi:hypothetical protein